MKQKINCNWHRYVDLGLPSGLLWATCNVGAKEPWESGLYFSWGNVDGHAKDSGYDFGTSNDGPYASTPGGKLATDIPVDARYDAARANLGGSWRMPTTAEFWELRDNCTNEWTTQNGVNGERFISRINGNSVFFPATSYIAPMSGPLRMALMVKDSFQRLMVTVSFFQLQVTSTARRSMVRVCVGAIGQVRSTRTLIIHTV